MIRHIESRRTILAYSPGGHFSELERALAGIRLTDCLHVTYRSPHRPPPPGRVHYLCHPRRSVLRFLVNLVQSLWLVWRERPEIVISSGADVAFATLLWGKLFGATVIFLETAGSLEPSLTGRLVYPFADLFIVQWPQELARFPRAVPAEGLLL